MKTIKRIMAVLLSTATIICYIPTIAVYAAPVDDIEISPEEEDEVIVESFAEDSMSAEDSVVVKVEGNAVDSVDESSINAIKDILSKNVGENETSTINILIEEKSVGAYDGTAIKNKLDEAFEGATVPIEETYLSIQITQDITSESGTVSYTITDLGSVIDIVYTPANGVKNLKVIVRDDGAETYTRFKWLDYVFDEPEDGIFVIDDSIVHIYTQSVSTYALGSAEGVFEVSFDSNGGNETFEPVFTNQLGNLPTFAEELENSVFVGWVYDIIGWVEDDDDYENDEEIANPGDPIIADTILWAKWVKSEELIPTTIGVVVETNNDGEDTVTLLDGARYGKEANINTVVGKDKKTYKITRIENYAFDNNHKLTSLVIGPNVTHIGDDIFLYCEKLRNVTVDMVNIPEGTFTGCSLTNLTIGPHVRTIGTEAFAHSDITKVTTNKVVTIGEDAFWGCEDLVSVKITKSVKTIGIRAFAECENLKSLTIGSGVETIGEYAFNDCEKISTLKINMKDVPDLFFTESNITKLTFGANVKTIGASAFEGCNRIKTIAFKNVESLDDGAFAGTGIVKLKTGKLVSIGNGAFSNCYNLVSVKITKSVKTIGENAFGECEKLKTINIRSGLETIGDDAFWGCENVSKLTVNMKSIPDDSFSRLTMVKLVIGPNVKTIGNSAFYNCERLKTVKMGENVKTIDERAFSDCENLRKISIGKSITYIGADVFTGDEKLGFINVQSEHLIKLSAVDDDFIGEIKPKATIKLPENVFAKTKAVFEEKSGAGDEIRYSK